MKNILTKKKFVALFATVCAFVLLLVGIPFAAAPASAAATPTVQPMSNYIVDQPTISATPAFAAVKRTYKGDMTETNQNLTWIRFGDNTNINHTVKQVEGNTYTEVGFPIIGSNTVGPHYFWVGARTKVSGNVYDSEAKFISPYAIDQTYNNHRITGRYVSGNVTVNQEIPITVPSNAISVYVSFAYQGECYDFLISLNTTSGTSDGVEVDTRQNYGNEKKVAFNYTYSNGVLSIKSPWAFTASEWSCSDTNTGGVAWYIDSY